MYNKGYRKKTIFPNRYSKMFYDFWWTHAALWGAWMQRLKEDKDAFVLITGDTSTGKSHLAGNLIFKKAMKEDNFILNDGGKMFIPEEDYIIDPEEFSVKMITSSGRVLWGDEFLKSSDRQSWFDPINKAIITRKNTNRKLNNIYIVLQPYETQFNPKLASHLTLWIWVKKRGVAELYTRVSGRKGGKGLDIQGIIEREEKYRRENPKSNFVPPTIHREYVGRMAWGKLTKKLERLYNDLVEKKSSTGNLTDEEKIKYGIDVKKEPKDIVMDSIEKIKNGEINDKKTLWNGLNEVGLEDDKKLKLLNFYLKLEGWSSFSKLFDNNSTIKTNKKVW